jgi:hypothetical protein
VFVAIGLAIRVSNAKPPLTTLVQLTQGVLLLTPTILLPTPLLLSLARVQMAKFDFSGASRRLRAALSRSKLLTDPTTPDDGCILVEIAAACGATEEEQASLTGATATPFEAT